MPTFLLIYPLRTDKNLKYVLVLCFSFTDLPAEASCVFSVPPKILLTEGEVTTPGGKLIQSWEVENSDVYWTTQMPDSISLSEFKKSVLNRVDDISPVSLLKKALIFADPLSPEGLNLSVAIAQAHKSIRPANCLESLLLSYQTDRMDMARTPTEFIAFVLRSKIGTKLKIFYYTVNQPGIGGLGEILSYVKNDLNENPDWYLWMNLHNHNFFLAEENILGVTSPSSPDVGAFRSMAEDLALSEAWVTNGFDTITISSSDFWNYHTSQGVN